MDLYGRALSRVLYPAWERLRGRPTLALLRALEHSQWWSHDELVAHQSRLLQRLIAHAYTHSMHYRRVLDERGLTPADVGTPDDLRRLPILDRDAARASAAARRCHAVPPLVIKETSGSTGKPMTVVYGAASRNQREATRLRGYAWAGYEVGRRALHVWGTHPVKPRSPRQQLKVDLDHRLRRDRYVDCARLDDTRLAEIVGELHRYRPEVIIGYSQATAALARHVLAARVRDWDAIPVLACAERLLPHDREAITAAFGPVYETYGCREVMLIGAECEVHDGLHTSMETLVVEIVVREGDRVRAARPGESGEVVVTDLHNVAMPFIRYATGDVAIQGPPERCACGRGLARIRSVEGRVTELLRDRSGAPVAGMTFAVLFSSLAERARQVQLVQHASGDVTFKIVPAGQLTADTQAHIRDFITRYLPGTKLAIDVVDDIPAGPAGKRRLVVVERRVNGTDDART